MQRILVIIVHGSIKSNVPFPRFDSRSTLELLLEYNCAEAEDGSDVGWWGVGFRVPAWRLDVGPIASAT